MKHHTDLYHGLRNFAFRFAIWCRESGIKSRRRAEGLEAVRVVRLFSSDTSRPASAPESIDFARAEAQTPKKMTTVKNLAAREGDTVSEDIDRRR
jgi:hypothetical protein